MSTYDTPFVIELSTSGLTLLATLADPSDPAAPHSNSDYVDIGGWTERGPVKDADGTVVAYEYTLHDLTLPEGARSSIKFHTGAVGAGADFSGVTVLAVVAINPEELETQRLVRDLDIDGKTLQEALRYVGAVLAGKVSGAGTGTETFVGLDGATDRVASTVDVDGNRTSIDYDP